MYCVEVFAFLDKIYHGIDSIHKQQINHHIELQWRKPVQPIMSILNWYADSFLKWDPAILIWLILAKARMEWWCKFIKKFLYLNWIVLFCLCTIILFHGIKKLLLLPYQIEYKVINIICPIHINSSSQFLWMNHKFCVSSVQYQEMMKNN